MPELPDITVYQKALRERIQGATLERLRVLNPFLLRTVDPTGEECENQRVTEVRRLGKRLAMGLENDIWLVLHLMIAGRLQWTSLRGRFPRTTLLACEFSTGTLQLTEAGTRKQASLHLVRTPDLKRHDPGGIEPLECTLFEFQQALTTTNRTLKRQLTMPQLFSGIGNAYSDEILHRAQLSPITQTQKLTDAEAARLYAATRDVLTEWVERLERQRRGDFPKKVTAFRPEMAVHGKFGQPCPVCGSPVQRIVYAENETNYCATCQTAGRVLADRSLSRLLKQDWPRRIEDWDTDSQ